MCRFKRVLGIIICILSFLLTFSVSLFAMDPLSSKAGENIGTSTLDRFCHERDINKLNLQIASSETLWKHYLTQDSRVSPLFHLFQSIQQDKLDDELFEKMTFLDQSSPFFQNLIQSSQAVKRHQLGLLHVKKGISLSEEPKFYNCSRWFFLPFWKTVNHSFEFISAPAVAASLKQISDNQRIMCLFHQISLGNIPPLTHLELIQLLEVFPMRVQSTVKQRLESGAGVFTTPAIFQNELKHTSLYSINTEIIKSLFLLDEETLSHF